MIGFQYMIIGFHYMIFSWLCIIVTWLSYSYMFLYVFTSLLHDFYVFTSILHGLHVIMMFLHHYYMDFTCFTWQLHVIFSQPIWSMYMRKLAQDHPPGWLLPFYQCLEQNQCGIIKGAIPVQWGTPSWWWNAMTVCLRDGMSRQPKHTLKDGLTNPK